MTFFRKGLLILIINFFIVPSYAMIPVVDVGAIVQLGNQLSELRQQAIYAKMGLKQLTGAQFRWGNAQGLIKKLQGLTDQTTGLASDTATLNKQFRGAYPGYQASQNFSESYKNNVNSALKKLDGVSQAMGASSNDFSNENNRLTFLQQQSEHAQGQTQAIQASSQIASETVSQLQLLRQSVLAQSNAQVAFYATQIQKEASTQAELEKIIKAGSTQMPSYGSSGHALNIPNF